MIRLLIFLGFVLAIFVTCSVCWLICSCVFSVSEELAKKIKKKINNGEDRQHD